VGEACESAAARRVALQFGLSTNTVRAIDLRYLQRWSREPQEARLRNMGVDEIHLGKKQKFITVVSNLDAAEPLWFGQDRKKDTLDEFFEKRLSPFQRGADSGRLRGYVGSVPAEYRAVVAQVPHHL
jgi:transposase